MDLTHIFGTQARQALDNARRYRDMPLSQRLDEIEALYQMARASMRDEHRRLRILRMEEDEMRALLKIGRQGHV